MQHGLQDVLILIQGVHQDLPTSPPANQPVYIAPGPAGAAGGATGNGGTEPALSTPGTEADKLRQIYKSAGEAQNHVYGEGLPGAKPPDFTKLPATPGAATPPVAPAPGAGARKANQDAGAPAGGRDQ
jgi:hypothetical protein